MITFDRKSHLFHLHTPGTSYVMKLYGGDILEHIYWGKRLNSLHGIKGYAGRNGDFAAIDAEYSCREDLQEISTGILPQEYATFGSCDYRKPAFHAIYADGSRITKLKYTGHKIYAGKPKLKGLPATYVESDNEADTLEIFLHDGLTGLSLVCRYTAFTELDVITRSVEVINEGNEIINLQSVMSAQVDIQRGAFDFINLSGAWGRERHVERRPLRTGVTKVESRRGSSSHHNSPFFALVDKDTTEEQGNVYGFSFVYSGNFEAGSEVDPYGHTRAFMGINSFDFNWRLEPGDDFTAPEVVMVYSANGLGNMSRTFHKLYRTRLARGKWRDAKRPVLLNNWEATYFNFTEEKILEIARCAKKAGIELLVLDDGWFGERNQDNCSLGDWEDNLNKLPNGIVGLAEKVNSVGLKFGLWFEPEMISPNSNLYRVHPNWCLHVKNRGRSEGRNQLILDLSRKDVQDYIISVFNRYLSSASISYVKWDMNRNMTCVGSANLPAERQAEVAHRYMLGLYHVLETVVTSFPDVLFEGCSGGGGRFDAGQMCYFNQFWTSDNSDAVERLYIQHGTSMVMPASFMAAHVSAVPNHQVFRTTPLRTRGYVAMCGQFGYELDVTKMSTDELAEIKHQIKKYKEIEEIIHKGEMYRTESPFESNHTCWTYVSEDKTKAIMFYFTIQAKTAQLSKLIKVPGLDTNKIYRLKSTGEFYSGAVLMNHGIYVDHEHDAECDMFEFEAIV